MKRMINYADLSLNSATNDDHFNDCSHAFWTMKFLFLLCISLLSLTVWSQEEISVPPPPEKTVQEPEIFVIVEEQAEFPGGMGEYLKYIETHLVLPKDSIRNATSRQMLCFNCC